MPDLSSPFVWFLALSAALCIGMAKTGLGGLGIVAVSLFAQLFPAKESTGAILPLMIFADVIAVYFYRCHANWPNLAKLLPATLAGIVCGWWIMPLIPDRTFAVMLGWVILALMLLTVLQRHRPSIVAAITGHPLLGLSAGWAMGVTTMLANAAGAIAAFYFLTRRMDKMTFVGTAAWFFLIVNLAKIPFSVQLGLINIPSLSFDLMLLPVVALGCAAGRLLLHRIPQWLFEWLTIGLASAGALRLILSAW